MVPEDVLLGELFSKSAWLACLAATFVMHVCVRLSFGDSYSSNLSGEMGESWLAN